MANIRPYTISIPREKVAQLKQKLEHAQFPDELDNVGWGYGAPLADVKRIAKYWAEKYDWAQTEKQLNELPNYIANIEVDGFESIGVHFVHQRSESKNAIPLIFVHGCES